MTDEVSDATGLVRLALRAACKRISSSLRRAASQICWCAARADGELKDATFKRVN
jgi:hypothetical protein